MSRSEGMKDGRSGCCRAGAPDGEGRYLPALMCSTCATRACLYDFFFFASLLSLSTLVWLYCIELDATSKPSTMSDGADGRDCACRFWFRPGGPGFADQHPGTNSRPLGGWPLPAVSFQGILSTNNAGPPLLTTGRTLGTVPGRSPATKIAASPPLPGPQAPLSPAAWAVVLYRLAAVALANLLSSFQRPSIQ